MFFGKFFQKDHRHHLAQAEKQLAAKCYADARFDFQEALKRCPADAAKDLAQIRLGLGLAGNALGEMNLREAERFVVAGELAKACDHFTLAGELAVDETLRAMAFLGVEKSAVPTAPTLDPHLSPNGVGTGSCASCKDVGSQLATAEEISGSGLSDEDRFFLMVQPLPGELAGRYAALGEEFRRAYLLIQDGLDLQALPILHEISLSGENDIVLYEVALIMYRSSRVKECEALLNRSLLINPENQASYLALVHLLSEGKRFPEAIAIVERMKEGDILADQAQFMLGDLHEAAGDEAAAVEAWSQSLALPAVARLAAERLVPLLGGQGRNEEATYLIKRYLHGCC
jgi:tetratricopeptide (TPR) repeat protein